MLTYSQSTHPSHRTHRSPGSLPPIFEPQRHRSGRPTWSSIATSKRLPSKLQARLPFCRSSQTRARWYTAASPTRIKGSTSRHGIHRRPASFCSSNSKHRPKLSGRTRPLRHPLVPIRGGPLLLSLHHRFLSCSCLSSVLIHLVGIPLLTRVLRIWHSKHHTACWDKR